MRHAAGHKSFFLYDRSQGRTKKTTTPRKELNFTNTPKRGDAREYNWFCEPSATTPESSLCMAVLHRAILDLITPGTPEKYRKSAANWLNGAFGDEFEADYALSFSRIIETLTPMSASEFRQTIFRFADSASASTEAADPFRFQRR